MNLLINEPPLQVLPSLAKKVGLNEAIFLQQLHFRSLISSNVRDGYKWVYKTYAEWQQEFPFWSTDTIKRAVRKLEKEGYIIATSDYNRMKIDNTKWYRINYEMCQLPPVQFAQMDGAECADKTEQNAPSSQGKLHKPITKEIKSIKKDNVENNLDVVSVIDYLNKKTGRSFKASSSATQRFINARYREGHTLDDFKRVIDIKVKEWLKDDYWNKFLRPSTLFTPKNFENYLEESKLARQVPVQVSVSKIQPPQLDFGKGEF